MYFNGFYEIYKIRRWVILAASLFFFSLILAGIITIFTPELIMKVFAHFFQDIHEIGDKVFGVNPILGTWNLFVNNFRASLVFIFGGLILSIPTLIGLTLNGGAIGALGVLSTLDGVSPFIFLLAILPHGIVEIPAILISSGYGLKIGWELIIPPKNNSRLKNLKTNIYLIIKILPIIILLLIIAAILEIFVTPFLLNQLTDINQLEI